MVKIRLKRMGAHKKPFYRIVVADSRSARDGRFIEEIGYYNPLTDPADVKIDGEKARKWLSVGAQATDTVKALLKKSGALDQPAPEVAEQDTTEQVTAEQDATEQVAAEQEEGEGNGGIGDGDNEIAG